VQQKINLTQSDLDELANQAASLGNWLQREEANTCTDTAIPYKLTTVTSYILFSGLLVMLDKTPPASTCWMGGCFL